jgi:hypothetical protein
MVRHQTITAQGEGDSLARSAQSIGYTGKLKVAECRRVAQQVRRHKEQPRMERKTP